MVELCVCVGTVCHLQGSHSVVQLFKQMIEENRLHEKIDLKAIHCMNDCPVSGVTVLLEGRRHCVKPENARAFFRIYVMPAVEEAGGEAGVRPA